MQGGDTMLRVANVQDEDAMEAVRDALDRLDIDYRYASSDPDEDTYPQTAYYYVPDEAAADVENAMDQISAEYGIDAETL